jgi:hypothetical protein
LDCCGVACDGREHQSSALSEAAPSATNLTEILKPAAVDFATLPVDTVVTDSLIRVLKTG